MSDEPIYDEIAKRVPPDEVLAQIAMTPRELALAEQREADELHQPPSLSLEKIDPLAHSFEQQRDQARAAYAKLRKDVERMLHEGFKCSIHHAVVLAMQSQILRDNPPLET